MATDTQQPTLQETEGDDAGPRGRTLLQKALIAAIILVGPTLWQLTSADGIRIGIVPALLLIPLTIVLGYSLLLRFPNSLSAAARVATAVILCSAAFWVTFSFLLYIYLVYFDQSIKDPSPEDTLGGGVSLIGAALAGGVVWRSILRTGVRWPYEIGALLAATVGPFVLGSVFHLSFGEPESVLVLIIGFVPFMIIAWRSTPRLSTRSLLLLLLAVALPFLTVKAIDDTAGGASWPLQLPNRVVVDQLPPPATAFRVGRDPELMR